MLSRLYDEVIKLTHDQKLFAIPTYRKLILQSLIRNVYKWHLGLLYKVYLPSGEIAVTDGELNDKGHNIIVDWPKGKAQPSNHDEYVCL